MLFQAKPAVIHRIKLPMLDSFEAPNPEIHGNALVWLGPSYIDWLLDRLTRSNSNGEGLVAAVIACDLNSLRAVTQTIKGGICVG